MKHNMGIKDAIVRVILGTIIALSAYYFKSWWGLLAFFPLLTAYFGFCPFYKILGINTIKKKSL